MAEWTYEAPWIEIVEFDDKDIITGSGGYVSVHTDVFDCDLFIPSSGYCAAGDYCLENSEYKCKFENL